MVEKVLLLLSDRSLAAALVPLLKKWGVDHVDVVDQPSRMRLRRLVYYTTVVIDTRFAGWVDPTSKLIQRMRRRFLYPIVGVRTQETQDAVFDLQVAGCNFGIDPYLSRHFSPGSYQTALHAELCELLNKIEPVLERQQKAALKNV